MPGNARNLYTRHERATCSACILAISFFQSLEFTGFCYLKQWSCGLLFYKQLDTQWQRERQNAADGQQWTHWSELKNSLARHGTNARWPLGLWLNYCLNYICPGQTKLCHSMLTFICTTGWYSWLCLKYNFLNIDRSKRMNQQTIVSGLNLGVTNPV